VEHEKLQMAMPRDRNQYGFRQWLTWMRKTGCVEDVINVSLFRESHYYGTKLPLRPNSSKFVKIFHQTKGFILSFF